MQLLEFKIESKFVYVLKYEELVEILLIKLCVNSWEKVACVSNSDLQRVLRETKVIKSEW